MQQKLVIWLTNPKKTKCNFLLLKPATARPAAAWVNVLAPYYAILSGDKTPGISEPGPVM